LAVLAERRISLTENAVEKRGIWYKHGNRLYYHGNPLGVFVIVCKICIFWYSI